MSHSLPWWIHSTSLQLSTSQLSNLYYIFWDESFLQVLAHLCCLCRKDRCSFLQFLAWRVRSYGEEFSPATTWNFSPRLWLRSSFFEWHCNMPWSMDFLSHHRWLTGNVPELLAKPALLYENLGLSAEMLEKCSSFPTKTPCMQTKAVWVKRGEK